MADFLLPAWLRDFGEERAEWRGEDFFDDDARGERFGDDRFELDRGDDLREDDLRGEDLRGDERFGDERLGEFPDVPAGVVFAVVAAAFCISAEVMLGVDIIIIIVITIKFSV